MRYAPLIAMAVLTGSATGAVAADSVRFAQRDPDFPPRVYSCRLAGTDVALGGQACLTTIKGRKIAECGILQNVSTWAPSGTDCQ